MPRVARQPTAQRDPIGAAVVAVFLHIRLGDAGHMPARQRHNPQQQVRLAAGGGARLGMLANQPVGLAKEEQHHPAEQQRARHADHKPK